MDTFNVIGKGVEDGFISLILYGLMWGTWYMAHGITKDKSYPWWALMPLSVFVFMFIYAFTSSLQELVQYLVVGFVLFALGVVSGLGVRRWEEQNG